MRNFIILTVVGLIAQLIDGDLGMAYGVTSTSLLVLVGVTLAIASTSVHISEAGTTFVSGVAHWRFGNVDWYTHWWDYCDHKYAHTAERLQCPRQYCSSYLYLALLYLVLSRWVCDLSSYTHTHIHTPSHIGPDQ